MSQEEEDRMANMDEEEQVSDMEEEVVPRQEKSTVEVIFDPSSLICDP